MLIALEALAWFWRLGQKTCCGSGLDFALPASSLPIAMLGVPVCLSPVWLYPRTLFLLPPSPSPPSSQPNDGPQVGLPRSKQSRVLACVQRAQQRVPLSAPRCQFIKGSRCSGRARDDESVCVLLNQWPGRGNFIAVLSQFFGAACIPAPCYHSF